MTATDQSFKRGDAVLYLTHVSGRPMLRRGTVHARRPHGIAVMMGVGTLDPKTVFPAADVDAAMSALAAALLDQEKALIALIQTVRDEYALARQGKGRII
jgi:hypothetical protein